MPGRPYKGYGKRALSQRVTVRLPDYFVDYLLRTSSREGKSVSDVIRASLEQSNPELAARRERENRKG